MTKGHEMLNLKSLREATGLSVNQMSSKLGVKADTYRKWESEANAIPLARAWECADVLHCSLDELAGREKSVLSAEESELLRLFRSTDARGRETILNAAHGQEGETGASEKDSLTA